MAKCFETGMIKYYAIILGSFDETRGYYHIDCSYYEDILNVLSPKHKGGTNSQQELLQFVSDERYRQPKQTSKKILYDHI